MRVYSLSADSASLLREASQSPGGVYVPITGLRGNPDSLVESGLATYREVRQVSDTPRSVRDPRPCEWTDLYLVPTQEGLDMLAKHERMSSKGSK